MIEVVKAGRFSCPQCRIDLPGGALVVVPLHFLIIITRLPLALRVRHHVTSTA